MDPRRPFKIVYAIYEHQYLGCVFAPYVVPVMSQGQLSLAYQGLTPGNITQFDSQTDKKDHQLVALMAEIDPKAVARRFGAEARETEIFYIKKFKDQIRKMALSFVQRKMAQILPMLSDRVVYEMGNDGYPAGKAIQVLDEKASILFHLIRQEDHTRYYPTIKLKGNRIDFIRKNAVLVCKAPAWMLHAGELFTFDTELDGRKLNPFLNKYYISVPKDKESEYYRKFVTQLVAKHRVRADGFDIRTINEAPAFSLKVEQLDEATFNFKPQVKYDRFTLGLKANGPGHGSC